MRTHDIADRERTAADMMPGGGSVERRDSQPQRRPSHEANRQAVSGKFGRAPGGATYKAIDFLADMVAEVNGQDASKQAYEWAEGATSGEVSKQIDRYKDLRREHRARGQQVEIKQPERKPEPPKQITVTQTGVYVDGDEIYAVVPSKSNPDRLYAKRVVEAPSERLTAEGDRVSFEYQYAPGAIYRLTPEMRLDAEQARALQIRFERCLMCRRPLKVADSVARGIGPVCSKRIGF